MALKNYNVPYLIIYLAISVAYWDGLKAGKNTENSIFSSPESKPVSVFP